MSDILERLRKSDPTNCTSGICPLLKDEAAEEIARLREQISMLEKALSGRDLCIDQLRTVMLRASESLRVSARTENAARAMEEPKITSEHVWAMRPNKAARRAIDDAAKAMEDK